VENLWMTGAFLVDDRTTKIFFAARVPKSSRSLLCARFRPPLRLFARRRRVQFEALPRTRQVPRQTVTAAVHRFEESIAGHVYLIEVANVSKDRWRAYIVKIPGVPTALMPFYGTTPADAAEHLCSWLTRAHARAAAGPPPV
jgi:hypothetical protein